jgi:phosphoribosylformylglycinamidine (FGAM) synthase-like enzyme
MDGSFFEFQNATTARQTIENMVFLFVWTEHCGYHAFFVEDLERWQSLANVELH